MKKTFVAALLGATLMTGTAMAAAHAHQDRPMGNPMARADANGDGVITRDEALAEASERFAKLDRNHDGRITSEERPEATGGRGARVMDRMDSNRDGVITLEEQRMQAAKRFDRIDTNHDGKIDKAEIETARARMTRMFGNRGAGSDGTSRSTQDN